MYSPWFYEFGERKELGWKNKDMGKGVGGEAR